MREQVAATRVRVGSHVRLPAVCIERELNTSGVCDSKSGVCDSESGVCDTESREQEWLEQ